MDRLLHDHWEKQPPLFEPTAVSENSDKAFPSGHSFTEVVDTGSGCWWRWMETAHLSAFSFRALISCGRQLQRDCSGKAAEEQHGKKAGLLFTRMDQLENLQEQLRGSVVP